MKPPTRQSAVDSIRNWRRIVRRRAPSALRVPISFVRSFTLTKVMFMIPIAPTKSDSPVMKRPAIAIVAFTGSSVDLKALLFVDIKIVAFFRRQPTHATHDSGKLITRVRHMRFVAHFHSDVGFALGAEIFFERRQRNDHDRVEAEEPEESALAGERANNAKAMAID